jgi:co-chaperonin GroES (HSP10)|nr:MAG TPA: 10 kDa chaperonin [Caudoviricetes sp.]
MSEKIVVKKQLLKDFKPTFKSNGRVMVLKDKVTESGDIITDLFNSFGNLSIKNDTPVTGVIVYIPDNVNKQSLGIEVGDRILSVHNKVIYISDQEQQLFLVLEDDILAKIPIDLELDFVNMKKTDVGSEDDYYGFNQKKHRDQFED